MSNITTTSLSDQYQSYFSKDLLNYAVQGLALNDYAQQADLPKNVGSKKIAWFRYDAPAASNVQTLTEGTAISTSRDLTLTKVEATLAQYGEYAKVTDILSWTELYDAMAQAVKVMGQDAAIHADQISRNALVVGAATANEFFAKNTSFANLASAAAAAATVDSTEFLRTRTRLVITRAPKFGTDFVAVVPPQHVHDLRKDERWFKAMQYGAYEKLFKDEIGKLDGIRYVEATNPFIELSTEDTYDASGGVFSSIVLGKEAFGTPKLTSQSPFSPSIIIVDKPDSGNPLLQYKSAGWKAFWTAKVLNDTWYCNLRGKTSYA